jgi:hypothetical protein
MTTITKEKWTDVRPLLFAPALLILAYLCFMPGFFFWFIGPKNLRDWAFGVPAFAVFLVILAIWQSMGSTLLLIFGTASFFYETLYGTGNTYGDLRKFGLNPGLLISVNVLMIIVVAGDVFAGRIKSQWRFKEEE